MQDTTFVDSKGKEWNLAFRYWKLVSGNISSSMTVLSDCVFVAAYDATRACNDEEIEQVVPPDVKYVDEHGQSE